MNEHQRCIFRSAVGADVASRGGERSTVAKQLKNINVGVDGGQRQGDDSCAQHGGSEGADGRKDMSKAAGMASTRRRLCTIVKSDNEPARVLSTLRAIKSGIENSLVGSSKSNGIVVTAIQSVQGMFRTTRSAIKETWEVKIVGTHSVWPWIAEQA